MSALPLPHASCPDRRRARRATAHRHLHLVRRDAARAPRLDPDSLAVIRRLGELLESNDHYTFGHCERVADYAVAIARVLGLDDAQLTTVRLGAYLHDLGKVRVPSAILNKPGGLGPEEIAVIREHPTWGVALLSTVALPWDVEPIVRWHHERLDGSGYPDGLSGEDIPLAAQIIGIADSFDAMTSTRSYRAAATTGQALAALWDARRSWHPDVHAAFLAAMSLREMQSRITPWRRRIATLESIGSA
jgi:putative nucleotidyltransferase with HDIG domain